MENNKYPRGLYANKPHEKAPDFVKCSISVHKNTFIEFLHQVEIDEKGYTKFQVKEGRDGKFYVEVDTWKPNTEATPKKQYTGFSEIQNDIKRTNTVKDDEIEYSEDINPDDIPFN